MRARVYSRVRTHVRACEAGAARRGRNGGGKTARMGKMGKMGKMATDFDGGGIAIPPKGRNGANGTLKRQIRPFTAIPPPPRLGVAPTLPPKGQPAAPSPASRWAAADNRYLCARRSDYRNRMRMGNVAIDCIIVRKALTVRYYTHGKI